MQQMRDARIGIEHDLLDSRIVARTSTKGLDRTDQINNKHFKMG
jgi:hypothetical protein